MSEQTKQSVIKANEREDNNAKKGQPTKTEERKKISGDKVKEKKGRTSQNKHNARRNRGRNAQR